MMLTDARQATAAANRMLTTVRSGAVGLAELREALAESRAFIAAGTAFQTAAAELIAARQRHGDGGVEILAASAGLSQREARNQVATVAALQKVPKLRDAVQTGAVPQDNARRLAAAITKTGAEAVADDTTLLKQASRMRPEQFAKTAQRWINTHQTDDGTSEHQQQRARRHLKMFDTDDGMVALRGEFDKITGTRIHNRLLHTARQLLNTDKKLPKAQRREFPQCLADALQHHTTKSTKPPTIGTEAQRANGTEAQRAGTAKAEGANASVAGPSSSAGQTSTNNAATAGNSENTARGSIAASEAAASDSAGESEGAATGTEAGSGWIADITVLAHIDDNTGELIGELSDGTKLPAAVLEELSCNARWTGLIHDRAGDATWRSRSRRSVTETQWQTLLATYGGCFHCGAPAGMCQAHHITPYSKGGATNLDNLIMVCWNCHHKIHHHNWRIDKHSDGSHSLHPPDRTIGQPRHGPACADDYPPEPEPPPKPPTPTSPTRTSQARTSRTPTRNGGAQDNTQAQLWTSHGRRG
ncbi:MAG: HNH endonuclease [Acidimicrobiaceae bacterium]|nr:HNH endonuclease [Acidimicrobiaceae bacterium]